MDFRNTLHGDANPTAEAQGPRAQPSSKGNLGKPRVPGLQCGGLWTLPDVGPAACACLWLCRSLSPSCLCSLLRPCPLLGCNSPSTLCNSPSIPLLQDPASNPASSCRCPVPRIPLLVEASCLQSLRDFGNGLVPTGSLSQRGLSGSWRGGRVR